MSEISRVALFGKLNGVAYKAVEGATVFASCAVIRMSKWSTG